MIIEQRVKDFENLGFGLFVHFGLYSVVGHGEWVYKLHKLSPEEYEPLANCFNPAADWAEKLVASAKGAGCKYITLTTRHHDGFSLYDTCGLSDYDAPHFCGRDLIREFVDACNAEGIIPFFYHTLLDWREKSYEENFPEYLKYLRRSIEILCTNYGKIGGLWFDGMWEKKDEDWEEDELYGTIRKHQPDCIIVNNTGLSARGEVGHMEIDSLTYERGMPTKRPEDAPKYLAGEMCESLNTHWGYAEQDFDYKSPADMIRALAGCRRYGANFLLNVGPMGDGLLRPLDRSYLGLLGEWVKLFEEAVREPKPTDIEIENKPGDFLLKQNNIYYLFCDKIRVSGDSNVIPAAAERYIDAFEFSEKIKSVTWLDTGEELKFTQDGKSTTINTTPFLYGRNTVVRVAKIVCE